MRIDEQAIDQVFARWNRTDSPGCAVGISKDGEIVFAKGYGMANLEHGVPITPGSIFHVASVSKQFATFCIGLLEAEGRLSVDDEVRAYVPRLPDFGHPITIRHLIHHTSGIRDQWELLRYAGWREEDLVTEDDVMGLLERQTGLNFEPGEKYLYSNSGYTLLAVIINAVSGQSLRDFAHERVFAPLGMTSTHFHDDHTEIVPGRTQAYTPRGGGGYRISIPEFALAGATSLFTTVEDLAKWDRNFTTAQVGSPELLANMQQPGRLRDGKEISYGWAIDNTTYRGAKVVGHAGADHGYRAHFMRLPGYGITVSCLANLSVMVPGVLCERVVDVLLGDQLDAPEPSPSSNWRLIPSPAHAQIAGTYREPEEGYLLRLDDVDGRLTIDLDEVRDLEPNGNGSFTCNGPWPVAIAAVAADKTAPAGVSANLAFGREPIRLHRVETAEPDRDTLAAYAGRYWSDELRCFYDIVLDGDTLAIERPKHRRERLYPAGDDRFFRGFLFGTLNLAFERDPEHRITGFTNAGGRVSGLRFRRMPAGTP